MARRKRPRLFSFSRDVELAHYDEIVREPASRALLEALIDAFIEICADRRLTDERLAPIARAAGGPDLHLRLAATNRLAVLSHYFPAAVEALGQLLGNPDEEVRVLACASVTNAPPAVAMWILEHALKDPSWRVRKAAAQVLASVPLEGAGPVAEQAAEGERDARVRVVLQLARDFQDRDHSESL